MSGTVESVKDLALMVTPNGGLGPEVYTAADKDAIFERILKRERDMFQGYILFSLGNLSRKCKRQQFFTTSAARFHGLSRYGVKQQAQLGYMLKITSFDAQTKVAIAEARELVRYQLILIAHAHPHALL